MICVSIPAKTNEEALLELASMQGRAELVELRIDRIHDPDLPRLLAACPCPAIVTNRPNWEGGHFAGPEEERIALLDQAIDLGAAYVDVELKAAAQLPRRGATKRIVSYHSFEGTPSNVAEVHRQLVEADADIPKIVGMANDIADNLRMFELLKNAHVPTIALCMGERGRISRILSPKFGGYLAFAAAEPGRESAPGQLTVSELTDLYHYHNITASTDIYGVIANPVAHSMSPAILNAAFQAAGIDAVYVPFLVDDAPDFVQAFKAIGVKGYSVTMPHKQTIIPAMDEVDELVTQIGAMNTVHNREGRLYGTNTDWQGATRSLEAAMGGEDGAALKGKRVVVLGAGGAARAVAFGLKSRGAHVTVVNRTHERGVKLAQDVGCECRRREELGELDFEILVNTTSVGMHPNVDESPVPAEILKPGMLVLDAVYNPLETRLLREAAQAGCKTATGFGWFVNQAAAQFELWTGKPAPIKVMKEALFVKSRLI